MSSLQIAEITGKEHRHVTRDISEILGQAEIDASKFGHTYKDSQNRDQKCYNLPRRECDLVISGYSVKYRLAIIDRWQELEAKQSFQIPQTLSEALRLAADQAEKIQAQSEVIRLAAPKAEFYDVVIASNTVCQVAVAAQVAGLPFGRNTLFQMLRADGVLITGGTRHNLPKQSYINQGLFVVKESSHTNQNDETFVNFTSHVTQKGIDWLIKNYSTQAQTNELTVQ